MKRTDDSDNDHLIARLGKVGIGQYTYGWFVCDIGKTGEKAKVQGVEVLRNQTFHPSLASAAREAALRTADSKQAKSLEEYAGRLEKAVEELKTTVERVVKASKPA